MKMVKISFIVVVALTVSCGTDRQRETATEDSKKVAEEANEEKFDARDDKKDADFVAEQVALNYAAVQMAKLASAKATNAEVKNVAKLIENEHTKTLKELQTLATQKAISVPTEPEDQFVRKLENLSKEDEAVDFNKEWTKEMLDKHEEKIEAFEDRLEKSEDAELKAWITQTLPNLRSHLDKLKACNEKLKDS